MSISSKYPSVRPAKVINLNKKTLLNSNVEYSRGGVGTYVDENGLIVSAAPDQPRFSHNPETLEYEGLLVEEARTNVTRPSDFSSLWNYTSPGDGTKQINYGLAPDGTVSSIYLQPNSAARVFRNTSGSGIGAGTYTVSLYYKGDKPSVGGPGMVSTLADLGDYGNGWKRAAATLTFTGGGYLDITVLSGTSVELWGIQAELGSYPTSYIPTSGSVVTRPADLISVSSVSNVKSGRIKFSSVASNSYSPYFTLKDSALPAKPYVLELGSVNSAPVASVVYNSVRQGTTSIPSVPGTGVPSESTLSFNFEPTTGAVEISSTASDDADSHVLSLPAELSRPLPADQTLDLLSVEGKSVPLSLKEIYLWETALTIDQLASVSGELRSIGQPVEPSTGINENSDYADAGSRPTLDLRFAERKDLFDDTTEQNLVTFSRGSTATYIDEEGVIQTAVADEPRFDHDPATGESLGLLIEESRTNNIVSSAFQTFDFPYTYFLITPQISLTNNRGIAPDGTFTASLYKQIAPCVNNQSRVSLNNSLNGNFDSNSQYYYSFFVKLQEPSTTNKIGFSFSTNNFSYTSATTATYLSAGFTFSNSGEITSVDTAYTDPNSLYKKYADGWYRISIPIYSGSVQTNFAGVNISIGNEGNLSPSTYGKFLIWGACIEKGSFTTSYISSLPTFTSRASTATYYDATGTIQTAQADEARDNAYFPDENGVFHPAGLLLESAGTNLLTYSEQFDNAAWAKNTATVTANTATSPDGTTTADKLIANSGAVTSSNGNSVGGVNVTVTTTSGSAYVFSFYAKAAEFSSLYVRHAIQNVQVFFDLSNNTVSGGNANIVGTISDVGSGWKRIAVAMAGAVIGTSTIMAIKSGPTGDGTSGILLWGAQFELGSVATSYIPTSGSAVTRAADVSSSSTVTRNADVAQITGSNFSSWFTQNTGSFYCEADLQSPASAGQVPIFGVNAGHGLPSREATRRSTMGVRSGSSNDLIDVTGSIWNGEAKRFALTWVPNDCTLVDNGAVVGTDTSTISPLSTVVQLYIGQPASGGQLPAMGGHISRLTYWPTRLPDTTLQVLTDPAISTWDLVFDSSLSTDGTCAVITASTCTYTIDWGDGTLVQTINATGTGFTTTHRYTFPQTYKAKIEVLSGAFRPFYNNSGYADQLVEIRQTPDGWTNTSTSGFGTTLNAAWNGADNLKVVDRELNTSGVTNFISAWSNCTSLASFPLLDTSSGTNFTYTWQNCFSLASFPLLDTSNCTNFYATWSNCTSLASFPLLDTSSGTDFTYAWQYCYSLTSFPLLDTSSGTSFAAAWRSCTSLTSFPTNFFNSWTATPASNCFLNAWNNCTSLTPASVENILNSISISPSSSTPPASGTDITIGYNATITPGPDITVPAIDLVAKGWAPVLNNVTPDPYALASLDLDFATNLSLTDNISGNNLITFSRGSVGTYVDSNGVIQTAAADTPRFDHDPVTGESLGLLIEESRTNIIAQSENFQSYSTTNATISTETLNGPFGIEQYTKVTLGTFTQSSGYITTAFPVQTTGLIYTSSAYVKNGNCRYVGVAWTMRDSNQVGCYFDLETGTLTQARNYGYPFSIVPAGNGWYKISVSSINSSGFAGQSMLIYPLTQPIPANGASNNIQPLYDGDGEYLYTTGWQHELGSFPTSYIPTTGATATRAADVVSITGTNFSSWYNQSEGTVFTKYTVANTSTIYSLQFDDTTTSNNFVFINNSNNVNITTSSVLQYSATYPVPPRGDTKSIATAIATNNTRTAVDGTLYSLDSSVSLPTVTQFRKAGNTVGTIARLTYWPKRLTDTSLQYLTT